MQGIPNTIESIRARLVARPDTGCAIWPERTDRYGYGLVSYQGSKRVVHKILWEAENGPVPDGLELDHYRCDTAACAELSHLEPVTPSINCQRRNTQNGYTKGTQRPEVRQDSCRVLHSLGCWYERPNGTGYCKQARRGWRVKKGV